MNEPQAFPPDSATAGDGGAAARHCPECHCKMPGDSPFGVCPRCLLCSVLPASETWPDDLDPGFLDPIERPGILGLLDGYIVLGILGEGATGIVFKAEDPALGRRVAIKVLRPGLAASPSACGRFLGEARAIAAVGHENIVAIHAVGEWKGLPYLVMSYVSGTTLAERIRRSGPLQLLEILRIGQQISAGLERAHGQGVIHRDIKPANVLLENTVERVKLTDFGFAQVADGEDSKRFGLVLGTPGYMAPEQLQGQEVDERSDLFSVGCVVYAMGAGESPFRADDASASFRKIAEGRVLPLNEVNPELPAWLGAMVDKLLQVDPAKRVQSATELEAWFSRKLAGDRKGGDGAGSARVLSRKPLAWAVAALVVLAPAWAWHRARRPVAPADGVPSVAEAAIPADAAERIRFEKLFRLVRADRLALPSLSPEPLFTGTAADDLDRLLFVGSLPREARGVEFDDLHRSPLCEEFRSDPAATFVFLIIGDPEDRKAVERDLLPRMREWQSQGDRPAGGVWMAGVCTKETLNLLPESSRQARLELWIAVNRR
jgi:hypothetical protein